MDRFDVDDLDEDWPFEIDQQLSHLFKHPGLGLDDVRDVWANEPLFYPARPPAHWLMVCRSLRTHPDGAAGAVEHWRPTHLPSHRLLRRRRPPRPPLPGGPMTSMTPDQENAFYADPANQVPQGPPVRRKVKLSEPVPVRFPEELLREVRNRAAAEDRSVSNWVRRAVEHELARSQG